ncbi:MAG: hypothetical protein NZ703_12965, partial [Gemmataceae bacterium]|nr:hypothetical protein [Gemmataceae bacterium]
RAQILCRALLAEPESATVWLQQMREAPCSAAAAFFLGHLAAKLGQWSVAEHFYRRAWLQAEPTGRDAAAIRLVEVLRQQHRWQALLEVCQHRLRTGPTAGQHVFLWHQALALVHLGQLLEAEGVAELAWQLTPAAEQTAACLQQARLLELAGRSWAALQVLEQAEKAAPTDRERQAAGNARAALLCRLGRHQAAQALWEQLLQRYPDQAVACRELALLLLAHPDGDLQRAERLARHARYVATWQRRLTRQYPLTDALATGTLGRVLLCQQRNAEAQRLLAVAVTLPEGKNDRRLWHWLAEAYERCGDPERAAQARQRCQQLPADPTTMPP